MPRSFNCALKPKFMPHNTMVSVNSNYCFPLEFLFADSQTLESHKVSTHAVEKQNNIKMSNHFRIAGVPPGCAIRIPYSDSGTSYDIKTKMRLSPLYFLRLKNFKRT